MIVLLNICDINHHRNAYKLSQSTAYIASLARNSKTICTAALMLPQNKDICNLLMQKSDSKNASLCWFLQIASHM